MSTHSIHGYHADRRNRRGRYTMHLLGCMATSLLLMLGLVRLWPPPAPEDTTTSRFEARSQEVIALEHIPPTRQAQAPPPPPHPMIPIIVPEEVILEEVTLDLTENLLPVEGDHQGAAEKPGTEEPAPRGSSTAPAGPLIGPKTVHFVEPEYTREARRNRVRAELVIEVLVDAQGRVEQTRILERFLIGKNRDDKESVAHLGYGLEEAALSAARRWRFRPAHQDGTAVPSYTTLTFTFGV